MAKSFISPLYWFQKVRRHFVPRHFVPGHILSRDNMSPGQYVALCPMTEQKDREQDAWLEYAEEGLWTERGANDFNNQYYKVWHAICIHYYQYYKVWHVFIVSICHPLSVVACSSLVINPSLLSPGLFHCLQALKDPSMSWKENNLTGKITFIPGKGISFLLTSDVALYKDIQVTAFISYSLKRWMPMGRGRAGRAQIQDLEPLCRTTLTATKIALQHPLLQLLRRLQQATRCFT